MEETSRMTPARIAVVEDERIIAFSLSRLLQRLGYTVVGTAPSGEAALDLVAERHPDLVLMDIHLEGTMDGIEAAQRIEAEHHVPSIFLTAFAEEATVARARAARPVGFIVKPFELSDLHAAIQTALSRRTVEDELENANHRLQFALDAGRFGILDRVAGEDRINVDARAAAILGMDGPGSEARAEFLHRVDMADRPSVALALTDRAESDDADVLTFRIAIDGATRWIESHLHRSIDDQQRTHVTLLIRDVSERRQIEECMHRSRIVFETAAEGIFMVDEKMRIVSINPSFVRITGYGLNESVGRTIGSVLEAVPDGGGPTLDDRLGALKEGRWQGRVACTRACGEPISCWLSLSMVPDPDSGTLHRIGSLVDITQLQDAEERLEHLAHFDQLTGLPNRTMFHKRISRMLAAATRTNQRVAMLFLDLDGFKDVNESLGHEQGDELLKTMARRLRSKLRHGDALFRFGGDEFVVVVHDAKNDGIAENVARDMIAAVADPVELSTQTVALTTSVGIAVFPRDGLDQQQLLRSSDAAMYVAKATPGGNFAFFTPELAARSAKRLRVVSDLRRAFDEGEIRVHFQPVVDFSGASGGSAGTSAGGRLSGLEALVRWEHPQRGILMPDQFIGIAEQSGLIDQLGRLVLSQACCALAGWLNPNAPMPRIAVNVSRRELRRLDFDQHVKSALEKSGLPPHLLELEISESSLLASEDDRQRLFRLKDLGVTLAVDDFGAGHTSLSALRHLPLDRIKIDRSMVHGIRSQASDRAMVEAIVTLSRALGLRVVAEGVESADDIAILRSAGCEEMQGYALGRPAPLISYEHRMAGAEPWACEAH